MHTCHRSWLQICRGRHDQKKSVEKALGQLGAFFKGKVQKKMVDLSTPANAPSTIKAKGSSNPLIDTGFLRQSIKEKVEMDGNK